MAAKKSAIKSLGLRLLVEKRPSPFADDTEFHDYKVWLLDDKKNAVGEVNTFTRCPADEWGRVDTSWISDSYRGKALYPEMLKALRDRVQKDGCKGIVSRQTGRHGTQSTQSWQKFAEREPRVREANGDYYLSAFGRSRGFLGR